MRKIVITLVALSLVAATSAFAATLLSESFSYPDGGLVPNGGWAVYSGTTTDIQVVSGRANGWGPNAIDDHVAFTPQTNTVSTYACFEVSIPAVVGAPKPIYFAGLKDAGTSLMVARVYVLPIGEGWTFGISTTSTSTAFGVTPWTSTLSYDTPYNLAIKYDAVAQSATLWVNPVSEASPSVTDVNTYYSSIAVSTFFLRQSASAATFPAPGYPGTVDWGFSVDNVGVGTTFDEACVAGPTPTNASTWGKLKSLYR